MSPLISGTSFLISDTANGIFRVRIEVLTEIENSALADLSNLSRLIEELKKNKTTIREARRLQACYPSEFQESLEDHNPKHDNLSAILLSTFLSPQFLEQREQVIDLEIDLSEQRVGIIAEKFSLEEPEVELIGIFAILIHRLKQRSKQQLIQFLHAVNHDEEGTIVLKTGNKGTEVRFRYRVPSELLEWFSLDKED